MNKRRFHHFWTKFRIIKPWYFLLLAVISAVICVFALRANNQEMIKLREAVYTADRDNTNTEAALRNLQIYVTSHMNTDLSAGPNAVYPPVQLKYTYERLVRARGNDAREANKKMYSDAQAYCESLNSTDFSGRNRVPCIEQYVRTHTTQTTAPIPDALYKFSFVSPKWSPDLAGWTMLVAILSSIALVISFVTRRWFRHNL